MSRENKIITKSNDDK